MITFHAISGVWMMLTFTCACPDRKKLTVCCEAIVWTDL